MRIPRNPNPGHSDSAMTPMIDVVFLLMIFFVCTVSFQALEQTLPSNLIAQQGSVPNPNASAEPIPERLVIELRAAEGATIWTINGQPQATMADVRDVLKRYAQIDTGLPVVLDIAGEVPLGDAVDVYDVCRLVGFDRVQFAASAPIPGPSGS